MWWLNIKRAKILLRIRTSLYATLPFSMSAEPPSKIARMNSTSDESAKSVPIEKNIQEQKAEVAKKNQLISYEFNELTEDDTELFVKKITENATLPVRASRNAAGFDLFSAVNKTIAAQSHGLVATDISIMLPKGTYGRVAPRSGLAYKQFIDVGAGVIDYDYRGNVGVIIFNHFKKDFEIKMGDRIAQLVIEKIAMPKLIEVTELDETERGEGGFGSTNR